MTVTHYRKSSGEFRLQTDFNEEANATWRSIGGCYDGSNREWVFPSICADRAEEEVSRLFGLSDTVVVVRVNSASEAIGDGAFRGWIDGAQVTLGGYVLASRRFRDGRAEIKAPLRAGRIPSSGGSSKKPRVAPTLDTVFEVEVREDFAEANRIPFEKLPSPLPVGVGRKAPKEDAFKSGPHLLRVDIPSGSREQTAERVRAIVASMKDGELLKRLRAAS